MQIIIPMSGVGKRFIDAGYTEPKPLIKVNGKPIIEYVVNMFPGENNFKFIINKEHSEHTEIIDILKKITNNPEIYIIDKHKLGPVYAISHIYNKIKNDESCLVSYCDYFMERDYNDFKKTVSRNNCDGAIPSYKGFHPHLLHGNKYASMRHDINNMMIEIKEKHSFTENTMDCYQSAGMYYFKSGKILKDNFDELMRTGNSINGEYYVSMVYDVMQKNGLYTYIYEVDKFCQWGTPQDLEEYLYRSDMFNEILDFKN